MVETCIVSFPGLPVVPSISFAEHSRPRILCSTAPRWKYVRRHRRHHHPPCCFENVWPNWTLFCSPVVETFVPLVPPILSCVAPISFRTVISFPLATDVWRPLPRSPLPCNDAPSSHRYCACCFVADCLCLVETWLPCPECCFFPFFSGPGVLPPACRTRSGGPQNFAPHPLVTCAGHCCFWYCWTC